MFITLAYYYLCVRLFYFRYLIIIAASLCKARERIIWLRVVRLSVNAKTVAYSKITRARYLKNLRSNSNRSKCRLGIRKRTVLFEPDVRTYSYVRNNTGPIYIYQRVYLIYLSLILIRISIMYFKNYKIVYVRMYENAIGIYGMY